MTDEIIKAFKECQTHSINSRDWVMETQFNMDKFCKKVTLIATSKSKEDNLSLMEEIEKLKKEYQEQHECFGKVISQLAEALKETIMALYVKYMEAPDQMSRNVLDKILISFKDNNKQK